MPVSVNGGPNPTVLRAAGAAPLVTNTSGNDVTVPNIAGVSIRGFSLVNGGASNTNAIAATFSAAGGGVTISNNAIAGGTQNAIDITTTAATAGGCVATISTNTIRTRPIRRCVLLTAYTCAKPPSTNNSAPVM